MSYFLVKLYKISYKINFLGSIVKKKHLLSVEDKADAAAQSLGWQHSCLSRIRIANTSA